MEEENGEREERENGDTQRNSAGTRVYGKREGVIIEWEESGE